MASARWSADRTRLKPIHRRIEARCREVCAAAGRTWGRLPYPDRERFLLKALDGMDPADVYRWGQRYSLGDILSAVMMPERGKHSTSRPGRAGGED